MHPLKLQYYRSRYIATVRFNSDSDFIVEGGKAERMALTIAKKETTFCFVKDIMTKAEVELNLVDNRWVRASNG